MNSLFLSSLIIEGHAPDLPYAQQSWGNSPVHLGRWLPTPRTRRLHGST